MDRESKQGSALLVEGLEDMELLPKARCFGTNEPADAEGSPVGTAVETAWEKSKSLAKVPERVFLLLAQYPTLRSVISEQSLSWSFGVTPSPATGLFDLSDGHRKVIFYAAAHSGVLFDYANNRQHLLQGHCNAISASCISPDRRWIATADAGPDSVIIIWDTLPHLSAPTSSTLANANSAYALPIRTIFDPHQGRGVAAMEFSPDAVYLYTLSTVGPSTATAPQREADSAVDTASQAPLSPNQRANPNQGTPSSPHTQQQLSVWDWTAPTTSELTPTATSRVDSPDVQIVLRASPDDQGLLVTNGKSTVSFWIWDKDSRGMSLQQIRAKDNVEPFHHPSPIFNHSAFLPTTSTALSTTSRGELVLWSNLSLADSRRSLPRGHREARKYVKVSQGALEWVEVVAKQYVVVGGSEGTVKLLDYEFRLLAWFDKIHAGPIIALSFASTVDADGNEAETISPPLHLPQFVALTSLSKIALVARSSRAVEPSAAPPSTQGTWKSGQVVAAKREVAGGASGKTQNAAGAGGVPLPMEVKVGHTRQTKKGASLRKDCHAVAVSGTGDSSDPTLAGVSEDYFVKVLVDAPRGAVMCVAASPRQPPGSAGAEGTRMRQLIAVVSLGGSVQILDAGSRLVIRSRVLEITTEKVVDSEERKDSIYGPAKKKRIAVTEQVPAVSVAWSPDRVHVAVGTATGVVKVLRADTLEDDAEFEVGVGSVEQIAFARDGNRLACADAQGGVSYFVKRSRKVGKDDSTEHKNGKIAWNWIGKARAHTGKVVALMFLRTDHLITGVTVPVADDENTNETKKGAGEDVPPRLVSIGLDRNAVEYRLEDDADVDGIKIRSVHSISQTAVPLCAILPPSIHLLPPTTTALAANAAPVSPVVLDPWILVGGSDFKLRVYSSESFMCRKTVVGPTVGGPVAEMAIVPGGDRAGQEQYLAWRAGEKLVGLMKLPLDGNPNKSLAIVAHPGPITSLTITSDPPSLLSADGFDGVVNQWTLNPSVLDSQIALGGAGFEPFLRMLDDMGVEGPVFKELEDYFYYAQLRAAGEDYSKGERPIGDTIPVNELEGIMAAMGYYQTEREVDEMNNEVQMGDVEATGKLVTEVGLEDVVKGEPMQRTEFDGLVDSLVSSQPGLIPPRFVLPQLPSTQSRPGSGGGSHHSGGAKYALPATMTGKEFVSSVLGMRAIEETE
ncbi:hypothetical protein HDU93_003752 [Gonapodya sp. JEL0774]|nr:hypothetical protein HDU93_003752 [Gonapodya sp. JEL0774]